MVDDAWLASARTISLDETRLIRSRSVGPSRCTVCFRILVHKDWCAVEWDTWQSITIKRLLKPLVVDGLVLDLSKADLNSGRFSVLVERVERVGMDCLEVRAVESRKESRKGL